jgi:hypothetical protein
MGRYQILEGLENEDWLSIGFGDHATAIEAPWNLYSMLSKKKEVRQQAGYKVGEGVVSFDHNITSPRMVIIPWLLKMLQLSQSNSKHAILEVS